MSVNVCKHDLDTIHLQVMLWGPKDTTYVYYGEQEKKVIHFFESIVVQAKKYIACDYSQAHLQWFLTLS